MNQMRAILYQVSRVTMAVAVAAAFTGRAQASELKVETKGHRLFADAGDSGGAFDAAAFITVVVTLNGVPVTNLGDAVPPNAAGIVLPPAWSILSSVPGPVGDVGRACAFSPTAFTNYGQGVYGIRVAPLLTNMDCHWALGDYHYAVRIKSGVKQGSALGVLTIPDTPSDPAP
jgi:hypothetical protein